MTIIQGWGMTETSPLAAFGLPPARRLDGHDDMYYKVKAGRVVGGVEVRVVAEDGTVLPNDGTSVGEFEIRGPWITGSYYKDEDPAKFHDGWLRTGDVGTLDGQGYMTISDRTKDVIKSGGEWISSVELENAVMAHPDVFEAAVIAIPDPKWSERPLVAVVPKPGRTPAPADLVEFLAEPGAAVVAARAVDLHHRGAQDQRGQVRQEGHACRLRRRRLRGAEHATAQVSGPTEAMTRHGRAARGRARGADRHGDGRARAAPPAGDPDSAETGEALAQERRILKARRALERCIAALLEGSGVRSRTARRRRRPERATPCASSWPCGPTTRPASACRPSTLGRAKDLRLVGPTRWHVTLRFLGDVAEERLAPLGDALVACAAAVPGPARVPARAGDGLVHRRARPPAPRRRPRRAGRGRAGRHAALRAGAGAGRAALQRPPHAGPGQGTARAPPPGPRWPGSPSRPPSPSAVDLVASEPSPQGHVYSHGGPGAAWRLRALTQPAGCRSGIP